MTFMVVKLWLNYLLLFIRRAGLYSRRPMPNLCASPNQLNSQLLYHNHNLNHKSFDSYCLSLIMVQPTTLQPSSLLYHCWWNFLRFTTHNTSKLLRLSIHQSSPTLVSSPARIGFFKAANFECSSDSSLAGFGVVIRYSDDGNIIAALSHKIFYFLIRLN